jgi:hypothetical protein
MSDSNIELPQDWQDQGWTIETASEEGQPYDEPWNADVVIAAADPSTLQGEGTEGETQYG